MENVIEDGIVNITLYSEETLKNLAYQQIWKGNGTKTDPFIIKNSNILGQEIIIKNSSLFLSFFNCNFDHVIFERSSNISLKHCTFNKLEVIKCSQFEITSSYISDLSMSKITDFQFKKSSIIEVSTRSKILEIIFEDCDINDNFLDSIITHKTFVTGTETPVFNRAAIHLPIVIISSIQTACCIGYSFHSTE